jgi:hypothetical protein
MVLQGLGERFFVMIPKKKLELLKRAVNGRFAKIQQTIDFALSSGNPKNIKLTIAYATTEGVNTWANFSRSYYLSMVIGAVRENGKRIKLGNQPASINDAIGIAVKKWNKRAAPTNRGLWKRRDEPSWHKPNILITLAGIIQADNLAEIECAFSTQSRVFDDLPVFRNFFAHRNQSTAEATSRIAPTLGIPPNRIPEEILKSRAFDRPQPILLDWFDDLKVVCEMLCH